MRVVEKPERLEFGGKGFRTFDAETEVAGASTMLRVRRTKEFVLSGRAAQRMLLAVAFFADEGGIAGGGDDDTGTAEGVSIDVLAKCAGMRRSKARRVLQRLCTSGHLLCQVSPHPPYGPVWVLLTLEDGQP